MEFFVYKVLLKWIWRKLTIIDILSFIIDVYEWMMSSSLSSLSSNDNILYGTAVHSTTHRAHKFVVVIVSDIIVAELFVLVIFSPTASIPLNNYEYMKQKHTSIKPRSLPISYSEYRSSFICQRDTKRVRQH